MTHAEESVVVSGRVRLARNYHDLPFSTAERPEAAQLCIARAQQAVRAEAHEYDLHRMAEMPLVERQKLMERHLISRDLLQRSEAGAVLLRADRHISIMINEEDHLRIQSMISGLQLEKAADEAFRTEELLEAVCPFSFDPQLGYLTSCPTNTGTGLRASLMLHLPMLTRYKQMGSVNQNVAKLGLTTRGIYGEGSEALGDLYQVSNQITLGRTEEEIIESVTAVGKQLIDLETTLRARCQKEQLPQLEDAVYRSYGLLCHARHMDEKEFMQHWSNLRLGITLGMLPIHLSVADELLTVAQDAHAKRYGEQTDPALSVERARCALIRKTLASI